VTGAIARHKLLVVLCALTFALLGVLGGAARKGTYTAASTLQVGKVNPNSPGFYGFVQSASDLATAFSRAIYAAPVLAAVHSQLGLSASQASGRLSAEPIPNSPAFRVIATGPARGTAARLANVTSEALIAYVAQSNSYSPATRRLLTAYRAASLVLIQATAQTKRAEIQYVARRDSARRSRLEGAQAGRAAASLKAQALASSYQLSAQSATTTELVSLLAGATTAASDRKSKIELLGFVGLLGGVIIGCTLAVLLERDGRLSRKSRGSSNG
jgi:uncharacterized protein involved in exopolysaccharide biosynthesis